LPTENTRVPSAVLLREKSPRGHVIPGIKEFLAEFTSEKAWGPDGYLAEKGLIPMPDAERKMFRDNVMNLKPMALTDL
jgi:phosphate transport system substrate-binding protein